MPIFSYVLLPFIRKWYDLWSMYLIHSLHHLIFKSVSPLVLWRLHNPIEPSVQKLNMEILLGYFSFTSFLILNVALIYLNTLRSNLLLILCLVSCNQSGTYLKFGLCFPILKVPVDYFQSKFSPKCLSFTWCHCEITYQSNQMS